MILATNNQITNITADDASPSPVDPNNLLTWTFDESWTGAPGGTLVSFYCAAGDNFTYVGISGHNLGTIGATISVFNHDVADYPTTLVLQDTPIFIKVPARSGGVEPLIVSIQAPINSNIVISHIGAGTSTDLSHVMSTTGQTIQQDYQSGYARVDLGLGRKIKSTQNLQGAPMAAIVKSVSQKVGLNISNIPTEFAKLELIPAQYYWVNNGFFISNDEDDVNSSVFAFNFLPRPPKTHSSSRGLVNLSYSFTAYNGL